MPRVQGYSEDEVDLLVDDFDRVVRGAIQRVLDGAAANLHEHVVLSSAHVFHLPGKHDQKTHGHSHPRGMKTISDAEGWSGGSSWQRSDDRHVRATNVWAESYGGQQGVVATMRNIHQGNEEVSLDENDKWLGSYARAENYQTGERYGMEAVRDDVWNAAVHLDSRLESPDTIDVPLYRGMRVHDAAGTFHTGDTFDSDVSSWTSRESFAAHYTLPEPSVGRPVGGSPVIMRIGPGSRGVLIDDGSLDAQRGTGEHLLRGTFRVTDVTVNEDDEFIVDVEQL